MSSPTPPGGDADVRENAEVLEAEAQLDAPTPDVAAPDIPEPEPEQPARAEPEPTPADRREAALAARASPAADAVMPDYAQPQRSRDEKGRFTSEEGEQEETEAPEAAEVEAEAPEEQEPVPAPSLPPGTRQGEDGQWYVDFVVDGQPQTLPYQQYHSNAQKYLTGDQRLQQAALERKRLEALQAQPQGYQPPVSQGAGVTEPPQGAPQGITRETLEKAFLEGDEQAQAALVERLNHEQAALPDASVIATQAAMQAREQIEVESAIAQVSTDPVNAMILGDSVMRDVADRYSESLRMTEPHLRPAENIARALQMTREHVARYAPAPAAVPPEPVPDASLTTRTAAKAAHARMNAPVGGQARQPLAPPPPAVPQSRDILAEMRIARGQR